MVIPTPGSMKDVLYNYDVYPKVVLANTTNTITVQPLGWHVAFAAEKTYTVGVFKLRDSNPKTYPDIPRPAAMAVTPDADGCLRFPVTPDGEGEYLVQLLDNPDDPKAKPIASLSFFALAEDMKGRIPLRGDLHMHTRRSDGKEAPAVVCANYRGHGYDFFSITDHRRYYPSLEAIEAWEGLTDFNIVEGEEVHLPLNDVHYINFGGSYSVNALVTAYNDEKAGKDLAWRSKNGQAPDPMTEEEFIAMIKERAKSVDLPYESERLSYAVMEWIYEHVQKGGGLAVFPHPYWLNPRMQLPEDYIEFIYRNKPFDAFEVLGGENYYAHNGFQTGFYYEMKAKGVAYPVVGSTDSHCSTENNRNGLICSTIAFAKENTRDGIIEAIKNGYSVAVDSISPEYRMVGDFRLMKYGSFLQENYFPLHDRACKAEGYYMNRHLAGDKRATEILKAMKGQIPEMQKKYFAV